MLSDLSDLTESELTDCVPLCILQRYFCTKKLLHNCTCFTWDTGLYLLRILKQFSLGCSYLFSPWIDLLSLASYSGVVVVWFFVSYLKYYRWGFSVHRHIFCLRIFIINFSVNWLLLKSLSYWVNDLSEEILAKIEIHDSGGNCGLRILSSYRYKLVMSCSRRL